MRFSAAALLVPLVLSCDGGLAPQAASTTCPAGICGVVHFRGAVPDSTDYVRVVVYDSIPRSLGQLLAFAGFSDPLPLGPDSARYACCITPLPPGPYAWVLVVWKKVGALDVNTAPALLQEAGSYLNPADTTQLGAVTVPASGGVAGINIVADFGRLQSISDFFPPAPVAR
jgi:hypothetical protein